ncbi:hypothetical protein BH11CYA1_BH11CYA1_43880 [soil metagenome]
MIGSSISARKFLNLATSLLCVSASVALMPMASEAFSIAVISPPTVSQPVDKKKLEALKNYDVIVFIDASHSMAVADCDGQSRWQWCKEQSTAIRDTLRVPLGSHLKMVAFSENFSVYPDINWNSVAGFFEKNKPSGNTDATRAIKSQLSQYFAARKALKPGETMRPLLIAMITDGCPDRPQSLRDTIVEASKQLNDSNEVAITFLQVGSDAKATRYLQDLDECLVSRKARYDIVTSKSFAQVNQTGLVNALLESVSPTEVAAR